MKRFLRPLTLAAAGLLLDTGEAWAHPGHHALEGIAGWVGHTLASPYHVGVVVLAVVGAGWALRIRRVRQEARDR